jgi:hypothetical protein
MTTLPAAEAIGANYRTDDGEYVDYDFYADNIGGLDWKATFFFEHADSTWSEITYLSAPADLAFCEWEEEDAPPPAFKTRVEQAYAKAKAGAA